MFLLNLLAQVCAFAAAVIGVLGDTWDSEKNGWHKLTHTGRWAVAIAVTSLLVSSVTTWIDQREQHEAAAQRRMIQDIAREELCLCYAESKLLADVLHHAATGARTPSGSDIQFPFETLAGEDAVQALLRLDLIPPRPARPAVGDREELVDFLARRATTARRDLNMTLSKYAAFLDRDVLFTASRISAGNLLRKLETIGSMRAQMRQMNAPRFPFLANGEEQDYADFIDLLKTGFEQTGGSAELVCGYQANRPR